MSSSVSALLNGMCMATGKLDDGKFLQIYPLQKRFASEAEWRTSVYQTLLGSIRFETVPSNATDHIDDDEEEEEEEKSAFNEEGTLVSTTVSTDPKDWIYKKGYRLTLPPGRYYIGDLCYALNKTLYHKVFGPDYDDGIYTSKNNFNHVFAMGSTGGDGTFRGSDRKEYNVDAGILGIAAYDLLEPEEAPYSGGSINTFTSPVTVKFHDDKFMFYGKKYDDTRLTIYINEDDEDYNSYSD